MYELTEDDSGRLQLLNKTLQKQVEDLRRRLRRNYIRCRTPDEDWPVYKTQGAIYAEGVKEDGATLSTTKGIVT